MFVFNKYFFSFKSYITFSFLLLCFIAVQCSKVLLPSFFLPKFLLPQNVAFSRISYQMLCMLLNPFSIVSFNLLDLLKILLQLELPLRLLRWFWINFRLITASTLFFFFSFTDFPWLSLLSVCVRSIRDKLLGFSIDFYAFRSFEICMFSVFFSSTEEVSCGFTDVSYCCCHSSSSSSFYFFF